MIKKAFRNHSFIRSLSLIIDSRVLKNNRSCDFAFCFAFRFVGAFIIGDIEFLCAHDCWYFFFFFCIVTTDEVLCLCVFEFTTLLKARCFISMAHGKFAVQMVDGQGVFCRYLFDVTETHSHW